MEASVRSILVSFIIFLGKVTELDGIKPGVNATNTTEPIKPAQITTISPVGVPVFALTQGGRVCLRATMKASFDIKYQAKENDKVVTKLTTLTLPNYATAVGSCASTVRNLTRPFLQITWRQKNTDFALRIDFKLEQEKTQSLVSRARDSWYIGSASRIQFTYSTNDESIFPNAVTKKTYNATTPPKTLIFQSSLNTSYFCNHTQSYSLFTNEVGDNQTLITKLSSVQLQAFNLPVTGQFSRPEICEADKSEPDQNTVPVIIGGVLAGVILLTIIGYCITKRKKRGYANVD
ncbi:lysosome-associated membrane glycoprotein 5-like [Tubulanus polymorphus]|uniref:lysosome-associated membrane glycoprotein 5-like n=1 Tax=Tubulanus polymorphus TaxID=672921 RepID=UPI003DA50AAA